MPRENTNRHNADPKKRKKLALGRGLDSLIPDFEPEEDNSREYFLCDVDLIRPNRYQLAVSVAIDPARRDVFVADAELDSVVKFNSRGTFKSESFGAVRSEGLMRRPTGLAFFERVLYVLDAERGEILRFRLTTDVPR